MKKLSLRDAQQSFSMWAPDGCEKPAFMSKTPRADTGKKHKTEENDFRTQLVNALRKVGLRAWKNNCGAWKTPSGAYVRYGVGNPGGGDILLIKPVLITQAMVGQTIGVFASIECKIGNNKPQEAQDYFAKQVTNAGGVTMLSTKEEGVMMPINRMLDRKL